MKKSKKTEKARREDLENFMRENLIKLHELEPKVQADTFVKRTYPRFESFMARKENKLNRHRNEVG